LGWSCISETNPQITKLLLAWEGWVRQSEEGHYLFPIDPLSYIFCTGILSIAILVGGIIEDLAYWLDAEVLRDLGKLVEVEVLPYEGDAALPDCHHHHVEEGLLVERFGATFVAEVVSDL
jgi:hypothetical protein